MEHYTQSRISKQAIDKRFNERTKNMLYLILQQVMSKQVACKHSLFDDVSLLKTIPSLRSNSSFSTILSFKLPNEMIGFWLKQLNVSKIRINDIKTFTFV